jgi:hypothetical protein
MRKKPGMVLRQHPCEGDQLAVSGLTAKGCDGPFKGYSRTVSIPGSDVSSNLHRNFSQLCDNGTLAQGIEIGAGSFAAGEVCGTEYVSHFIVVLSFIQNSTSI